MSTRTTAQEIFERYLRGQLSVEEAADAATALVMERKLSGSDLAGLRIDKPEGMELNEAIVARAEAFFNEINRRGQSS